MTHNIGTDQTYLLNEQYKDSSNLDSRAQLHALYTVAEHDWHPWVFDHFTLADDARVLEIGCGPCYLWRENADRVPAGWSITLSDFSAGMVAQGQQNLREAKSDFPFSQIEFKQIDAQELPFDDNSLDAVIANHMLYHVPDLDKALAEIARVLKPDGRFFAATNGSNHLRQLGEIRTNFARSQNEGATENYDRVFGDLAFRLETGRELLQPYFSTVEMHRYNSHLAVTEVEPIVAYIDSGFRYDVDVANPALHQFLTQEMEAGDGVIRIDKDTGLFEASGPIK